jgi:hypothetical protein
MMDCSWVVLKSCDKSALRKTMDSGTLTKPILNSSSHLSTRYFTAPSWPCGRLEGPEFFRGRLYPRLKILSFVLP